MPPPRVASFSRPFEDAAFGLTVDELSGIVDTDSGVHIILRLGLDTVLEPSPKRRAGAPGKEHKSTKRGKFKF